MNTPTPCATDKITFDANACIRYALKYGNMKALFFTQFNDFIKKSRETNILMGYFDFINRQAYTNLARAVNKFAKSKGIKDRYLLMKFRIKGEENLDKLFEKLNKFQEICSSGEIEQARNFFIINKKNIKIYSKNFKSDIPGDTDLKLLVCCDNHNCNTMFLVTDDSHFIYYDLEIDKSPYAVSILPLRELMQKMIQWKWVT